MGPEIAKRMSYKYSMHTGYREAIQWVAHEDEPNVEIVSTRTTVKLLSYMFKVVPERIVEDVRLFRLSEMK